MQRKIVLGIDEVGRGALAGPIIAAGVCIRDRRRFPAGRVKDSKALSPELREALAPLIVASCDVYLAAASNQLIDRIGIQATNVFIVDQIIRKAAPGAHIACDYIGAFDTYSLYPGRVRLFKNGESRLPEIAAASIIAKVYRDAFMTKLALEYPAYAFEIHKGYGTVMHRSAIKRRGPSTVHRLSFLGRTVY